MYLKKTLMVTLFFLFNTPLAFAKNDVRVIYEKPLNKYDAAIEKEIRISGAVENVAGFINEKYQLSNTLFFKFGSQDGPLYDPAKNEVLIPYDFVREVRNRFKKDNYSETGVSIIDATMDAIMHTLFHEFAHALIYTYKIPVIGKEEDAADGLASVLLIEYFENGAEIAISAADLFELENKDIEVLGEEDFWGEHSLDIQRFYSTLCYVYGSDAQKYSILKKDAGFSEEKAEICIEDYERLSKIWLKLLTPYLKKKLVPNHKHNKQVNKVYDPLDFSS